MSDGGWRGIGRVAFSLIFNRPGGMSDRMVPKNSEVIYVEGLLNNSHALPPGH